MVLVLLAAATMQVFPLSHFFAHPCFHSPHKSSNFVMPNAYKMIMDFFLFHDNVWMWAEWPIRRLIMSVKSQRLTDIKHHNTTEFWLLLCPISLLNILWFLNLSFALIRIDGPYAQPFYFKSRKCILGTYFGLSGKCQHMMKI